MCIRDRLATYGISTNAEVSGALLRRKFALGSEAMKPLRTAVDRGRLSIRGMDRTVRVAWTLSDLEGRTSPNKADVATAMSFRQVGGL